MSQRKADAGVRYSLVIPVYRNEGSIPSLLAAMRGLHEKLGDGFEVVFVDDGGPDRSAAVLAEELPMQPFRSQLIAHSRNFGSFAAIRTGLIAARGEHFAVMAADLQEPPELVAEFFERLARDECDVTLGVRDSREDPALSSLASRLYWWAYRRWVQPEVPAGGIDVFGCNALCRDQLVALEENNSSLVALLLWVGFRRALVPYARRAREHGVSAWTFAKKVKYMFDSLYAFSDLPIRLLTRTGAAAMIVSIVTAIVVLVQRLRDQIPVQGYTIIVLAIMFFGGFNSLGLGILGGYVWRAYENTKRRPVSIVRAKRRFGPVAEQSERAERGGHE